MVRLLGDKPLLPGEPTYELWPVGLAEGNGLRAANVVFFL